MRMSVVVAMLLIAYGALIWPLPVEREILVEASPDGYYTASYSWRPSGLIGAMTKDNPWVCLTIRERETDRVLSRFSTWADLPEEAEARLSQNLPW